MSTDQRTSPPPATPSRRRARAVVVLAVTILAVSVTLLVEANRGGSSVCASPTTSLTSSRTVGAGSAPIASSQALARGEHGCT